MEKKKRQRILPKKYKKGDVVRALNSGVKWNHIYFILHDVIDGSYPCIKACNLTGSKVPEGEYSFDLSGYEFPPNWFKTRKPQTFLRCKKGLDCIYDRDITEHLGNIIELNPTLWNNVCQAFANCSISEILNDACDCEYEIIQKEEDCDCQHLVT